MGSGQACDGHEEGWGETGQRDLLVVGFLLGEDPDAEVPVLVGLEGGGHEDVLPGRQLEAVEHLAQVDVGVRALPRSVRQEEVFAEVDVGLSRQLMSKQTRGGGGGSASVSLSLIGIEEDSDEGCVF